MIGSLRPPWNRFWWVPLFSEDTRGLETRTGIPRQTCRCANPLAQGLSLGLEHISSFWGSWIYLENIINYGPSHVASFISVCVSEVVLMRPGYCSRSSRKRLIILWCLGSTKYCHLVPIHISSLISWKKMWPLSICSRCLLPRNLAQMPKVHDFPMLFSLCRIFSCFGKVLLVVFCLNRMSLQWHSLLPGKKTVTYSPQCSQSCFVSVPGIIVRGNYPLTLLSPPTRLLWDGGQQIECVFQWIIPRA